VKAVSGRSAASYTYDGNRLRVVKSVSGGTTTVSIFSGSSVIAEYDNGVAPASPSYAASAATSSGSMLDPSQAYSAMPTKQAAGTR